MCIISTCLRQYSIIFGKSADMHSCEIQNMLLISNSIILLDNWWCAFHRFPLPLIWSGCRTTIWCSLWTQWTLVEPLSSNDCTDMHDGALVIVFVFFYFLFFISRWIACLVLYVQYYNISLANRKWYMGSIFFQILKLILHFSLEICVLHNMLFVVPLALIWFLYTKWFGNTIKDLEI